MIFSNCFLGFLLVFNLCIGIHKVMHDVAELYRPIIYVFQRAGDGVDHKGNLGGNKDTS